MMRCGVAQRGNCSRGFNRSANGALNRPSIVLDQSHHATIAATAMSQGSHTIVLIQYATSYQSRSYLDFPTVPAAMDAIVKMYEHKLKELNPSVLHITYDISDLYNYIDNLHDICGLVLDSSSNKYDPKDRNWIKGKVFAHLRSQAA